MPTLTEILFAPASLVVFVLYGSLMAWEALAPARRLPPVSYWRLRGIASFALYFLVSSYLPFMWANAIAPLQVADLAALPTWAAALVGLIVYELGAYAYHRSIHGHDLAFRFFHQMHHSAERHDTYGAFWFSPLDMVGWTFVSSLAMVIAGLSIEASTWVLYATAFLTIFQHMNVRTPRWLGYLVQRPESHSLHHAKGIHAFNYADLPLIDLIFGTFRNPPEFLEQQGFYDGASARVADMLACRDVSRDPSPAMTVTRD